MPAPRYRKRPGDLAHGGSAVSVLADRDVVTPRIGEDAARFTTAETRSTVEALPLGAERAEA